MNVEGFITLKSIVRDGTDLTADYELCGAIKPYLGDVPPWAKRHGIPLGPNTWVDGGRQMMAYLMGGRTPATKYVCSHFGVGTGTLPAGTGYTSLVSPLAFYDSGSGMKTTKPVSSITFGAEFTMDVELELASTEANGVLITEIGLFAYDASNSTSVLIARKFLPTGFQKVSGEAKQLVWTMRF